MPAESIKFIYSRDRLPEIAENCQKLGATFKGGLIRKNYDGFFVTIAENDDEGQTMIKSARASEGAGRVRNEVARMRIDGSEVTLNPDGGVIFSRTIPGHSAVIYSELTKDSAVVRGLRTVKK